MTTKSFPTFAFVALVSGGFAIGFSGIFMRLSDLSPVASAFWRIALASPFFWGWAWATHHQDLIHGKQTGMTGVVFVAGLCFASDIGLWHMSLHYTTVANATLLSNLAPIVIIVWMWIAHQARFGWIFLCGMSLALLGSALLVGPNALVGGSKLRGDALGFSTAFFYAAYQLAVKQARHHYSTARLMAWSSTVTALALLPFALLAEGKFWPQTFAGWWPLLGMAIICQIGGQAVITYAFAHLPSALSSLVLLIQPLTATVAAWIIFSETMNPLQMAGGLMVVAGIYLAKRNHQ